MAASFDLLQAILHYTFCPFY